MSNLAFSTSNDPNANAKSIELTTRELDCLQWAAQGKTAWETSVILNISQRTVVYHLNQAKHKLHCQTKIEAVAKSVAWKLINII